MAIMTMGIFFACSSDGDDIEKVALDVTAGESGGSSITFNIETSMCAQVAWMVTPTSEEQPSAADVLANGHKEEVNTTVDVSATRLTPQTEYTVTVAAKGHYGRILSKTLKMTTTERSTIKLVRVFDASYTDRTTRASTRCCSHQATPTSMAHPHRWEASPWRSTSTALSTTTP